MEQPLDRVARTARVFVVLIALAGTLAAQEGRRPRRVEKPPRTVVAAWHEPGLVAVKFRDGLTVRARGADLDDAGSGALGGAAAVLAGPARGRWARTHDVDEALLARLRDEARLRSGRDVPDLNLEFRLRLEPGLDHAAAVDALNALEVVELAWPVARPAPPPLPPDFSAQQGYQLAAPGGTGARTVWPLPGGTGGGQLPAGGGLGIQVCDVEYSFHANHVDLPSVTTLALPPGETPVDPFADTNHGTAVLGVIAARSNGFGVTGGAYGAQLFFSFANTSAGYNPAAAISRAFATALSQGDLILVEQQTYGPNTAACCLTSSCTPGFDCQVGLVPSEWDFSVYNAIQTAVALGIVVVEAAGNGSQNLDAPAYSAGHAPFLGANDSGAILVGAGASPGGSTTDRSRLGTSNYGATVDLQGWGENVTTTGYGALYSAGGVDEHYTAAFAGTSSASAIVLVACAQLQSVHRAITGHPMAPETLRDLLRATGSPQTSGVHPSTQNIGPRPDLAAALAALGTLRGCAGDDAWAPGFFGPPARREAAIAYDSGRGRVVVFGGENGVLAKLGDTWAWETGGPPSGSWTQLSSTGPSPRTYTRMAYDRRRDRLVLFGGLTAGGMVGDTWEFDGATWSLRSTSGPGPMTLHAMAYDIARERVVLFAPFCNGGCSTFTWEWDGTSWTGFPGGPSGRERAALAYDSDRARLVLFGGQVGVVDSGETWERAGTTWSLVAASGPGARAGAGLIYDTGRRRSVLFGGHATLPFTLLGDAWDWNGVTWHASQSAPLPDPRTYHAMAYHEARDTELVLGGTTPSEVTASVYHYRERADQPGIPFCFGDGSGAACPCANTSPVGRCAGCLSSIGEGGTLRSSGRASLANDTVTLLGDGMPDTFALYFQGTLQQSGGAGTAVGDGLRCAGGSLVRFSAQVISGGLSSYPLPGQLSVSQRGMVIEPGTRTYQVWYRNPVPFCTSDTYNFSNGVTVVWGL